MIMNLTQWEKNAYDVIINYGGHVDWEERFYICPSCGEPVYECDWESVDLFKIYCPICEDIDLEEE